jgi:chemotaxis protein CheD
MDFGGAAAQAIEGQRTNYYLHPGQIFVSAEGHAVTTILGSCVSVCLWDPISEIGGINHFLLPFDAGNGQASARFGNLAMRELIDKLLAIGAEQDQLQAKLFGGACVLEAFRNGENHLGSQNVEVARKMLAALNVPIIGEDVEGRNGRKLIFHTDTGSAWIKRL